MRGAPGGLEVARNELAVFLDPRSDSLTPGERRARIAVMSAVHAITKLT